MFHHKYIYISHISPSWCFRGWGTMRSPAQYSGSKMYILKVKSKIEVVPRGITLSIIRQVVSFHFSHFRKSNRARKKTLLKPPKLISSFIWYLHKKTSLANILPIYHKSLTQLPISTYEDHWSVIPQKKKNSFSIESINSRYNADARDFQLPIRINQKEWMNVSQSANRFICDYY